MSCFFCFAMVHSLSSIVFLFAGLIQPSLLQGTHMQGQIPENSVDRLKDVLKDGKVYIIKKFLCNQSKTTYRAVESPYMVQFSKFTIVEEKLGAEDAYPFCTYSLTAFNDIPDPGPPARFYGELCSIPFYIIP